MQELNVIGIEDGALLVASDEGERYRIVIDEALQSRLRQYRLDQTTGPRISPREVQAHIRAGLSPEDVASLTGASLEYIERFVGPVMAEREHIVAQALSVPVRTGAEVDPLGEADTFGSVIRDRLASLGATGERWASWKEPETGWVVKLEFTADGIDHDARWAFDPRKGSLSPSNPEATTLSQQGELTGGLIPRLRAVPILPDESAFDSGAFEYIDPKPDTDAARSAVPVGAIRTEERQPEAHNTADLLEALRKRRGEREATLYDFEDDDFEDEVEEVSDEDEVVDVEPEVQTTVNARRGRAAMPSWDEIVFGARSDDDPA